MRIECRFDESGLAVPGAQAVAHDAGGVVGGSPQSGGGAPLTPVATAAGIAPATVLTGGEP